VGWTVIGIDGEIEIVFVKKDAQDRSIGRRQTGVGRFCVKRSMTVALAQTGSERLPSIVGASDASMRTAEAFWSIEDAAGCAWTLVVKRREDHDPAALQQTDVPQQVLCLDNYVLRANRLGSE